MKQAVFHGQEMWIGIADVASGTIRETHTLEEAKRADFHTCFYFSEESEKKHENKDGIFFWVQDGKVELEYNDLSPYEKTLLETQIKAQVIILDQDESVLRKTMLSERQENNNRDGNRMQIQILYSCNEWKEHSSMKIVCATTNPEVLYALIGESIKAGDMEYGCEDKEKDGNFFNRTMESSRSDLNCYSMDLWKVCRICLYQIRHPSGIIQKCILFIRHCIIRGQRRF